VRSGSEGRRDVRIFTDHVLNGFSKSFIEGERKRMDFNALWLSNFYGGLACVASVDKADAVGLIAVPGENPNELLLTAVDCVFLSEVGIRP
jgi:hypothetical protein